MARKFTNGTFSLIWMMPIILIFLVGGSLQYVGVLTQTQSNWLALFLFIHVFLQRSSWKQIRFEIILFIFLLYIIFDYFQRDAPISYTLTYFYYITCTVIAAISGRVYAPRIASLVTSRSYFKIVKIFLFIELLAVSVQRMFTEQFISLSRAPIGYTDAIFGTFFLQSDAALAAVCELLTISVFFLNSKTKDRVFVSGLALAVIFLGNSTTSKIAILLVLILLLVCDLYRKLNIGRLSFNILIALGFTCVIIAMYSTLSNLLTGFFAQATMDYYHRGSWISASRFSPIGQVLAERINFFGHGALTYYNPLTKTWLYDAGFSTVYSLYLDFGLVGLSLYFLYQGILVARFTRNYPEFAVFMCVFTLFMAFNFALTDLTFIFSFNLILRLNYLRGKSNSQIDFKPSPLSASNVKSRGYGLPRATE